MADDSSAYRHLDPVLHPVRIHASYNDFGPHRRRRTLLAADGFPDAATSARADAGRWAAIHAGPDRARRHQRLGFQTLSTFHCDAIQHFRKHGFAYMGMKTTTDVVRENNPDLPAGWTEQCKDATKMGCGTPNTC